MSYVKFKVPDDLKNGIKSFLDKVASSRESKIRKGMTHLDSPTSSPSIAGQERESGGEFGCEDGT